jgi:hypothetical protein
VAVVHGLEGLAGINALYVSLYLWGSRTFHHSLMWTSSTPGRDRTQSVRGRTGSPPPAHSSRIILPPSAK